jgi:hypothetical protein
MVAIRNRLTHIDRRLTIDHHGFSAINSFVMELVTNDAADDCRPYKTTPVLMVATAVSTPKALAAVGKCGRG